MIKAVGNDKSLEQLALLVGERVENDLPFGSTQELQSLLVTNKNVINKSLGYLNLQRTFNCTVTRVRRSGIDLSPEPELMLKFGDKLMVAGEKEDIKELGQVFGNDEKKLSDTDFFPIAAGIVLGVLFGKLNISFSDSFSFSPGLTGGILIVALILSAIGKTGPCQVPPTSYSVRSAYFCSSPRSEHLPVSTWYRHSKKAAGHYSESVWQSQ